ncbi:MAG: glutamyl-tRNA reductase [Thermoproteus sp.]
MDVSMNLVDKLVGLSLTYRKLDSKKLGEIANRVRNVCASPKYPIFVLHTCNRVEVYLYDAPHEYVEEIKSYYAPYVDKVEVYRGVAAAQHLFAVAAGLDSMLIGETDVLGQLEEAYDSQVRKGTLKGLLKVVVEHAIHVGKKVRTSTGISRGPRSLSSLSVEYLKRLYGDLSAMAFCIVGAGSVGRGVAKELLESGAAKVVVLNRTVEKALDLPQIGIEVRPLTQETLRWCLLDFDVVYTAISSFEPVITSVPDGAKVKVIVDLGVPRNVASDLSVTVLTLDDMRGLAEEYNKLRRAEVERAWEIVKNDVALLETRLRKKWVDETISEIMATALSAAEEEGRRAGCEGAILAARSTAKRVLLPVVEQLKYMAENGNLELVRSIIEFLGNSYERRK